MNNKIIEVLDYLGEKIGLAIDWSANNVYPQVMEFLARYRAYEIVMSAAGAILCLLYVLAVIWFVKKKAIPNRQVALDNKNSTWLWEVSSNWRSDAYYISGLNFGGVLALAFGGGVLLICVILFFMDITDMAKWIFIPEYQFYNVIAGLMN